MDRLGMTALGMAAVRAMESKRADRLFDDPQAQLFLDAMPGAFDQYFTSDTKSLGAMFAAHGAIRTRFFDDFLLGAGCRQVVLLAAGLDTRAFRLDWPAGVHLFELDVPDVLAFKEPVLAHHEPRCVRITVPADLRTDWPTRLIAAGFSPTTPTAWLAEGLLIYLAATEATNLLQAITEKLSPGCKLAFEHSQADQLRTRASAMPSMHDFTEMWKSDSDQDFVAWLVGHGWAPEIHKEVSYGRSGYSGQFVTAEFTQNAN
ncbi:SAM-dependent methyltransferase [Actinocrispum sp. NPDC049592]|uniref:SAM-dependent methyltransferase n=1 Tax=Actinocrispum sp. NPDC049592 TaxID=3154835 RepID=UPI00342A7F9D